MSPAGRPARIVPAPVVVVLSLGAGAIAHFLRPIPFLPELGVAGPAAGALVCVAGLAVGLAGVREFHRHDTPTNPFRPTTALVTSGAFRFSRNPMYLGFVLLALGAAIATNSVAFLVSAALLALALDLAVIRPEERAMSVSFGEQFEEYRRRTRRWL